MFRFANGLGRFFGRGPVQTDFMLVPEQFEDDPVAQKTGWGPNARGGVNMRTHRLMEPSPDRLEVKATGCWLGCIGCGGVPMGLLIVLAGVAGLAGTTPDGVALTQEDRLAELVFAIGMILVGWLMVIAMVWVFLKLKRPLVIDRAEGVITKGKQSLVSDDSPLVEAGHSVRMPLEEVWAVQLISEFISPSARETYMIMSNPHRSPYGRHRDMQRRMYFSYELNLVLSTGERITVMDHSNGDEVEEAGHRVAEFLKVPLWNVIDDDNYIQRCCGY